MSMNHFIIIVALCAVQRGIARAGQNVDNTNTQSIETIQILVRELNELKSTVDELKRANDDRGQIIAGLQEELNKVRGHTNQVYRENVNQSTSDSIVYRENVNQSTSDSIVYRENVNQSTSDSIVFRENVNQSTSDSITKRALVPFPRLSRPRRAAVNVAFSAYLSHSINHLTNVPIRFDRVLLNDGGHYNPATGAFTAPLSGVYMFTFTFDTKASTFVRLSIDGVNQVDGVSNRHPNAAGNSIENTGGNTCIVHVNHGQAVLVEVYEISDTVINSSERFRLTTFSGFLLY